MTSTSNDNAESLNGISMIVENDSERNIKVELEELTLLPIDANNDERLETSSTSTVMTATMLTDGSSRDNLTPNSNEYGCESNTKSVETKMDENLASVPPNLQILDSIQRVVTPGAFRATSGRIEPASRSIQESHRQPSMDIISDCNGQERSSFNNYFDGTTTLEATLVTNEQDPAPPILVAAVSDKITLAEIVSVDNSHSNGNRRKFGRRSRYIGLLTVICVLFAIVICSVLVTMRLKSAGDDDDLPSPEEEPLYWNKLVTHHVFIYGGKTSCNDFSVGSIRLYCAGKLEVDDEALAFIDILNTSSEGTSCRHIGSNAVNCSTIISNGSFHVGIVFSCGRANYIDESRVAAAAFIEASNGSDCPNVTQSNDVNALVFTGLGHFCKYSQKDSDIVTWKLEHNLVMENGIKMENQCETEAASFISTYGDSSFDYCYQADRSCSSDVKNIGGDCAIKLDSRLIDK
jgi:hypothetical protein